jgi:ABC-2 type transport system ATP-binding protein
MSSSTPAAAIAAMGVRKSYGDKVVLDDVNLTVAEGSIFALLGPNGAGKTTMVRILSTLIQADAGEIRVAGHDVTTDPDAVRAAIGVTGQFSAVDNLLTGEENLRLMANLRHLPRTAGRQRVAELLEHFDLTDAARKPLSTYSGGMRRRLDLAMTLVGNPRLIFLDEPTTGLDPRSRRTMWQIIRDLAAGGVTILLTTQYLAYHTVSRRGRPARRPDHGPRPRPGRRRGHRRRAQMPDPRRARPAAVRRTRGAEPGRAPAHRGGRG